MKKRKETVKKSIRCCIAGTLAMTILVTSGSHSYAAIKKETKNIQVLYQKDAGEFKKTDSGKTEYVAYQKNSRNIKKIKEKFKNNLINDNEFVNKFCKNTFTLTGISAQELEMLQNEGVMIEKDYLLEGSSNSSDINLQDSLDEVVENSWDIKAIQASDVTETEGKKIKVAVLDSGLDKFSKLMVDGCINFVNPESEDIGIDLTGHGTAVQNIILSDKQSSSTESIAKEENGISMYSLKVLDEENLAPVSRIVSAIHWCIEKDINIINMSFGTLVRSRVLEEAVKEAANAGILMIAAAGNGGEASESTVEYPAAYDEVIGVGSVNHKMEVSAFSSQGEEVELVAPGENVPISVPWGFYGLNSGTSYAAPHVTAVAALLWAENNTKSAEDIRSLLRASANAQWEEKEAGNGMIDYAYAEKLASDYKCSDEERISGTNDRELTEFDMPEIVTARWASGDIKGLDKPVFYRHEELISESGKKDSIGATGSDDLKVLYQVAGVVADDQDILYQGNDKPLAKCRVMHAGRYEEENNKNYVNYVAAARCLYNCAYLLANESSITDKARLKQYVNNHYNSGSQSPSAVEKAKKDLRRIINAVYDIDLRSDDSKLDTHRMRILHLLGFAIHAATDAFSHQYVINPADADAIVSNTRIERLQGSLTLNNVKVKTNISFQSSTKSSILTGKFNTKDLDYSISDNTNEEKVLVCHRYYADNVSYVYARYDTAAKDCVAQMLSLFGGGTTVKKFDPRVFVNNSYTGAASGNARIPIYNLYENVKYAGYTPEQWWKGASSETEMKKIWQNLSFWK